jgi:hypothetical protein
LISAPFNLEFDTLVKVKARAYNTFGWTDYSQANNEGARLQQEPGKISTIDLDISLSTLESFLLSWDDLQTDVETGNSPILSYNLQMQSQSSSVWTDVKGQEGSFDTDFIYTVSGLNANELYKFRVIARNIHGWSASWSDEFTYHTSTRPDVPLAAVTTLVNQNVRILWEEPVDNYLPITQYKIFIANNDASELIE